MSAKLCERSSSIRSVIRAAELLNCCALRTDRPLTFSTIDRINPTFHPAVLRAVHDEIDSTRKTPALIDRRFEITMNNLSSPSIPRSVLNYLGFVCGSFANPQAYAYGQCVCCSQLTDANENLFLARPPLIHRFLFATRDRSARSYPEP